MKILIADDDSVARKVLQRTLTKQGYEVIAATDGAEAWEIIRSGEAPSMAILDWIMPGMDGPTLVKKIRESNLPNYMFTILLTAKSDKEDIVRGMESGADDYLTKPFNRDELTARLRAGLRIIELEKNLAYKNRMLAEVNEKISVQNRRMQRDLEAAAEIQKTLLPNEIPEADNIKFDWLYRPCDELAGDILNVFKIDERHFGLYILDVSGHGVGAALLSVTLSRILSPQDGSSLITVNDPQTHQASIVPPAVVAAGLNKRFAMDIESGQYFTLIYGILDIETLRFTYVSAGHPNPILISRRPEPPALNHAGMPIGFSDDEVYKEQTIALQPGDRLYFYSDGITEAMNADEEQFGAKRLSDLLTGQHDSSLKQSLQTALTEVIQWSTEDLADDVSVLALEVIEKEKR